MRREHQLAVDDVVLGAQRQEGLGDVAEIGARLLDDGAQLLEALSRLGADLARLAIDGNLAAEGGRKGDPLRGKRPRHRVGERLRRRVEGERVARAQARHGVEEERHIGTLRAIGPCTDRGANRLLDVPRVMRPADGRRPTTEQ